MTDGTSLPSCELRVPHTSQSDRSNTLIPHRFRLVRITKCAVPFLIGAALVLAADVIIPVEIFDVLIANAALLHHESCAEFPVCGTRNEESVPPAHGIHCEESFLNCPEFPSGSLGDQGNR